MRLLPALVAAALASGCLLPKPPAEVRYFTPRMPDAVAAPGAVPADGPAAASPGQPVRLRRVSAAAYLRARLVWRRGVEVGFYDLWRWTELPSRFAQEALDDELFERRGFQPTSLATAPSIDASLQAFEERLAPSHEAVVELDVHVLDGRRATILDRSFQVSRPIAGDDPEAIADALGDALVAAAHEVGEAVSGALGPR